MKNVEICGTLIASIDERIKDTKKKQDERKKSDDVFNNGWYYGVLDGLEAARNIISEFEQSYWKEKTDQMLKKAAKNK